MKLNKKYPNSLLELVELSIEAKEKADYNLAIHYLLQALQQDLSYTPALIELAILYDDLGDLPKAIDYYQRALKLDGTHYQLRLHYANALIRQERIEEGIEQIRFAIEINEKDSDAWYYLALTYFFYLNEKNKSLAIIQALLTTNPEYVSAYNLLGEIFFSMDMLDEATRSFENTLILDPANKDAHLALSAIYGHDLKDRQKSLRHSLYLLENDPMDELARHNAQLALSLPPELENQKSEHAIDEGMAYLYLGKLDQAEHALKKALRLNPNHPQIWRMLRNVKDKRKA